MGDRWLNEHIEKELELADKEMGNLNEKIQLKEIIQEGFYNTGKQAGYLHIYEKENKVLSDTEIIFYDKYKDRVACRFNLNDLLTKL